MVPRAVLVALCSGPWQNKHAVYFLPQRFFQSPGESLHTLHSPLHRDRDCVDGVDVGEVI